MTDRHSRIWFAALLVLTLAYFAPALTTHTIYFRDLSHFYYSMRAFAAESWMHGEVPLWDPFRNGGMPFLADPMNATFDPTLLFYAVLDRTRAFNAGIVAYYFASVIGAWLLARDLGRSPAAAFATAIIATYSGIALSEVDAGMNRHIVASMAPLVLLCVHRLAMNGRPVWLAGAAVAGAIQVFGGAPETVLLTWTMAVGWAWCIAPDRWRAVARTCAAGAVAALLAAVQIIPGAAWIPYANRGARYALERATFWSLAPGRVPEFLVPRFFGLFNRLRPGSVWGDPLHHNMLPLIVSLYLGGAVIALAVTGLLTPRMGARLRVWIFVMIAVPFVVSIAHYTYYGDLLYRYIGLLRAFRYPIKFLALVPLCAGIAAGAGLDALRDERPALRVARTTLAVCVLVTVVLWIAHAVSPAPFEMLFFSELLADFARGRLAVSFALAVTIPLIAFAATFAPRLRVHAILVLITVDLLAAGLSVAIIAPRSFFEREPVVVNVVRQFLRGGRLYRHNIDASVDLISPDDYWWRDHNALERLNSQTPRMFVPAPVVFQLPLDDVESRVASTSQARIERANWPDRVAMLSAAGVTLIATDGPIPNPPASLLPVATIPVGAPPLVVYANTAVQPGPRLVHRVTIVRSLDAGIAVIKSGGGDVIFGEQPGPLTLGKPSPWNAQLISHDNTSQRFVTQTAEPGFLLLPLPCEPGWRAAVDDTPVPLAPANLACSAVPVPPGRHEIALTYDAPGWRLGLTISIVTTLLLGLWVAKGQSIVNPALRSASTA